MRQILLYNILSFCNLTAVKLQQALLYDIPRFLTPILKSANIRRMLTTRKKKSVIEENRTHETDTGSASVQVGLLSRQIEELVTHLKRHPKDKHSRRGLLTMVSRRRRLLSYLEGHSPRVYGSLIKKLGLKK